MATTARPSEESGAEPAEGERASASRTRMPWFPVLAVLVCLLGLAWPRAWPRLRAWGEGWAQGRLAPARPAEPAPVLWLDPAAAVVRGEPAWTDPRWLERIGAVLTEAQPFALGGADEAAALEALAGGLAQLSFVERVDRCEVVAGRLALALALRKPVACIPVRGEYALVDEDGVVLEGRWPVPPRLGRAWLPVIGPEDDPVFARARAGDWLVEPEHLDAIDVALSLVAHLDEARRARLGRIVIDARRGRHASVEEPGVRLELEGGRVALFGRAPASGGPGELGIERKWQALARALELFADDPDAHDWDLVDLRWDRPDLALRNAPPVTAPAVAARPVSAPQRHERPPRSREDDGRPRVR